ncbi:hypothetical protein LCGC14_0267270 [marine sediment metagenome]|uniref:Uncharacterized protein n=1 Tax=marine sediment metagenome TaxID=412755 RepID=A0A0F9WKK9_9ZZZZ
MSNKSVHLDPLISGTTTDVYSGNTVYVSPINHLDYSVAGKPVISIRNTHAANVIKFTITGYYNSARTMSALIQAETTLAGVTTVNVTIDSRFREFRLELAANLAGNQAGFISVFNGLNLTGGVRSATSPT